MIQDKDNIHLTNWEIVSVNPNDKKWDWKDLFCFWGVNIQSIIAFSLITSLYLVYELNTLIVFLGTLLGTFFVYIFQSKINVDKLKNFFITFLILFILSPTIYLYISVSQKNKRTDYPGKEIAMQVQESWDQKFNSNISYVSGDEWVAGNLSYHLKSRPKWIGQNKDMKSKYKLSIVDVFKNNISEAVSKIGYFKVYGD